MPSLAPGWLFVMLGITSPMPVAGFFFFFFLLFYFFPPFSPSCCHGNLERFWVRRWPQEHQSTSDTPGGRAGRSQGTSPIPPRVPSTQQSPPGTLSPWVEPHQARCAGLMHQGDELQARGGLRGVSFWAAPLQMWPDPKGKPQSQLTSQQRGWEMPALAAQRFGVMP